MRRRMCNFACCLVLAAAAPLAAQEVPHVGDHPAGVPMRIRDYTFPSFLVLNFAPTPAMSLGKGNWGFEVHLSKVNNFQVSPAVERYLASTRDDGERRRLDDADAAAIAALPEGEGFFIDLETDIVEMRAHYGLTDRIDVGASIHYLRYSGGLLDGLIEGFHDLVGFSQQGRQYVPRDQLQVIIGRNGQVFARAIDSAPDGGFGDPFLFARYTFPSAGRWGFNTEVALKPPVASVSSSASSGGWDYGVQLTADRRWERDALIFNAQVVWVGDFTPTAYRVGEAIPALPAFDVSYIHAFHGPRSTRLFLQGLTAEHPLRDLVNSDLTKLEVQLTAGLKWDTSLGTMGVGITENLLNFDNTPDLGIHLSWATVVD